MEKTGLSASKAKELLIKYGPNKLPETPPPTRLAIFIAQLKSPLVYVLIGAAVITLLLREFSDTIVISIAILLNTILGYYQEERASNALQALKKLVHPSATVFRDGDQIKIPIEEVVPGDVVILNNGDRVPADGIVIESSHLTIEEAMLTGESIPITKSGNDKAFMGTVVRGGRGYMLAKFTGGETEIGKIATSVQEINEDTPLMRQLSVFSKQLTYVVLGLTVAVVVVGFFSGKDLVDVFLTAVALAVSAIPEGLLIALTAVLAVGMQRILKRKGLVRNLVSAETLGGVTTICTDKTGTLTEGKMKLVDVIGDDKNIELQLILSNDRDDPIVQAAWDYATNKEKNYKSLLTKYPRLDSLPFDSKNKFAATLNKYGENNKILINGAPEVLLEWSDISKSEKKIILKKIEELSSQGKRLMGMASKNVISSKQNLEKGDIIKGKIEWEGLAVFSDPVRGGIKRELALTQSAGIRLIVITGDYKNTALSVLDQLEIAVKSEFVIEGKDLKKMSKLQIERVLKNRETILFARTSPHEKLKIITTLKDIGEVVAMTGDGVNDAPALAKADIGIVVEEATDVAKESSDLVLLNSSFSTIVAAIEEGRAIFDNIRKVLLYLMSDAFEEIFVVIFAIVAGVTFAPELPLPLSAAQILYVNLISDGFPNLALTIDPKRKNIMKEQPRNPEEKLAAGWIKVLIFIVSVTGSISAFIVFYLAFVQHRDLEIARSVAFATIGVNSLVYVFSVRTLDKPFWHQNPFSNKWLIFACVAGFALQFAPFVIRPLGDFFSIVPIYFEEWVEVFVAAGIMFFVIEMLKVIHRKHFV